MTLHFLLYNCISNGHVYVLYYYCIVVKRTKDCGRTRRSIKCFIAKNCRLVPGLKFDAKNVMQQELLSGISNWRRKLCTDYD